MLAGETIDAHTPRDRRELLPLTPVQRPGGQGRRARARRPVTDEHTPAHLRQVLRRRLDSGPVASLKLASGCDRRCAFCAIPAFRGAFVSRDPGGAARRGRVAGQDRRPRAGAGQRELHLVRQGPGRPAGAGEAAAAARRGRRHRPGAGQLPAAGRDPARPGRGDRHHARRRRLLRPVASSTPASRCCAGCAGSAPPSGSWSCSTRPARWRPAAGARSNFIVGFPGETRADVDELVRFLTEARLDAIGVFDYSDEDGTEAAGLPGKVRADTIKRRYDRISRARRRAVRAAGRGAARLAPSRCWSTSIDDGEVEGRAAHQAPEVDGSTTLVRRRDARRRPGRAAPRRPGPGPGHRHRGRRPGRRAGRDDLRGAGADAVTDEPVPADRGPGRVAAQRGERPHRAADRAGPGLRGARGRLAADRRRLADRRLPGLLRRLGDRLRGRLDRPRGSTWSPRSARSPTRSPTRR